MFTLNWNPQECYAINKPALTKTRHRQATGGSTVASCLEVRSRNRTVPQATGCDGPNHCVLPQYENVTFGKGRSDDLGYLYLFSFSCTTHGLQMCCWHVLEIEQYS